MVWGNRVGGKKSILSRMRIIFDLLPRPTLQMTPLFVNTGHSPFTEPALGTVRSLVVTLEFCCHKTWRE